MSAGLVLLAAGLAAASGLPALVSRSGSAAGPRGATALSLLASAVGLLGALLPAGAARVDLPWALPGARLLVEVDGLSAVFLVPLFVVSGAGALFSQGYWTARDHPRTNRTVRVFYGLATAAMALVFVAKNAVLFLAAWEVMALSAFFLVGTEGEKKSVREASWIYLVATHVATLVLFALFALLRSATGSFDLGPLSPGLAAGPFGSAVFWLAVSGFGLKAGLMPLHVWLPGAHAAAPSHVSALMSGVLIKTGVYGLARVLSLFPDPPLWWGGTLLALGTASAVLGVAFALGQHDLKRLLAYHSVENVGIIVMGLGVGWIGLSQGRPAWVLLGFAGGLLHVVNHALFKSLLFLGAGAVVHATGTREMDRLGGLLRRMPRTGTLFLLGAVAICGLPPLNGFVSEWLVYLGLVAGLGAPEARFVPFAAPALALVGGLALACFVKAFGAVFLGQPRSADALRGSDHALLTAPMAALALLCAALGLYPQGAASLLEAAASAVARRPLGPLAAVAPLGALSAFQAVLAGVLALAALFLAARLRSTAPRSSRAVTWDCGYALPSPSMQYTSSSFARWTVGFFRWALLPETSRPRLDQRFPREARFATHVPETVLDRLLVPAFALGERLLLVGRYLQQGRMQLYLVYMAVTLVALLLWM